MSGRAGRYSGHSTARPEAIASGTIITGCHEPLGYAALILLGNDLTFTRYDQSPKSPRRRCKHIPDE